MADVDLATEIYGLRTERNALQRRLEELEMEGRIQQRHASAVVEALVKGGHLLPDKPKAEDIRAAIEALVHERDQARVLMDRASARLGEMSVRATEADARVERADDELRVEMTQVTVERDAAQAAYACVCEAVTPGCVGGAEATAIMATLARIKAHRYSAALRKIKDAPSARTARALRKIAAVALTAPMKEPDDDT